MIVALSVGLLASCEQALSQSSAQRRHLRVVLYPFIPEFTYAAETVKRLFEAENPNIELSLVDLSANYYAPPKAGAAPDPTYIGDAQADVYELDSVFLADFVNGKKIQALPEEMTVVRLNTRSPRTEH